jgi:hypothetical protein
MSGRVGGAMVPMTEMARSEEDAAMEPMATEPTSMPELVVDGRTEEELLVQAWRAEQLRRLGLPRALADAFADLVDWHELAALVARGCAPEVALEIVR